jgi:parallel beta-helix repeat protein
MNRALLSTLTVCLAFLAGSTAFAQGSSLNNGTLFVPDDHATIQSAVDAASSGTMIKVRDGTYSAFTVSTSDITIKALAGAQPVVTPGFGPFAAAITVAADRVKIVGLTTQAPPGPFGLPSFGLVISGDGHTLRNNSAIGHFGAFSFNAATNCKVIGNKAIGDPFNPFGQFEGFACNDGLDNTFNANEASDVGLGFIDRRSQGTLYKNNVATDCNASGFTSSASMAGDPPSIGLAFLHNIASGCATNGFRARGVLDCTFKDNLAIDGGGIGFQVFEGPFGAVSSGNELSNNEARNNALDGFSISGGSDDNVLKDNLSADNGGYGYRVDAMLDNVFIGNTCDGNTLGGSDPAGVCN